MENVVALRQTDKSGIYILPNDITANQVYLILLDGVPVDKGRYEFVSNGTAIDVFEAEPDSLVEVLVIQ